MQVKVTDTATGAVRHIDVNRLPDVVRESNHMLRVERLPASPAHVQRRAEYLAAVARAKQLHPSRRGAA